MARPKKPPRIVMWRGAYYLKFFDWERGKARRLACEDLGACTKAQRQSLVERYGRQEIQARADYIRKGGPSAYTTPLADALRVYLKHVDERAEVRSKNPASGEGLSEAARRLAHRAVERFEAWLLDSGRRRLTTGSLDGPTLQSFFAALAKEKFGDEEADRHRSMATVNKYRRDIKTCINYLGSIRPALFPDLPLIAKALRSTREQRKPPVAFSPRELSDFLDKAIENETAGRTVEVVRRRRGKITLAEPHRQSVSSQAATPITRLFLVLALTGCRRSEALGLKWDDVHLDRGLIFFRSTKTKRYRILPLAGAPEGDVAPLLLNLLRRWKATAGNAVHVLPFAEGRHRAFPQTAWQTIREATAGCRITPQALRQNFTSYAASVGIPATVAAQWQGHSADVAEHYYRAQVLERHQGSSIEEAMGLALVLRTLLGLSESAPDAAGPTAGRFRSA